MYEYNATLIRVVDGDTYWLDIDLGLDIHARFSCRLNGVNCPENSTEAGQEATAWVQQVLPPKFPIRTIKDRKEKYGRYLVDVYPQGYDEPSLAERLIAMGHAERMTT
jgi:micrococcal nuclease